MVKLRNIYGVRLFHRESVTSLMQQFQLGVNQLLWGVWGWWAFDVFTLVASYASPIELGAQTIMRAIGLMTFMVPVGISTACTILVGRSIA